jgi:RIO kinase 1
VVDAQGHPAPRLIDAQVTREQAGALYGDLRQQAVKMLCADLIHGDLSPYNVLLGAEGPVIIDFPQVVSAAHNSTAQAFFRRDVENVRAFLARLDPTLDARRGDAEEIWRAYVRRELSPDFVPTGRPAKERRPQHRGPQRPPSQQQHRPQQHGQQHQQHGHQHPQGQRRPERHGSQQAPQQRQGQPHGAQARRQAGRSPRAEARPPASTGEPRPPVERVHRPHTRPYPPPHK